MRNAFAYDSCPKPRCKFGEFYCILVVSPSWHSQFSQTHIFATVSGPTRSSPSPSMSGFTRSNQTASSTSFNIHIPSLTLARLDIGRPMASVPAHHPTFRQRLHERTHATGTELPSPPPHSVPVVRVDRDRRDLRRRIRCVSVHLICLFYTLISLLL